MTAVDRMRALRERRRVGRRIVVIELDTADLERLGIAGTARANEIVDAVLAAIRAGARNAPVARTRLPEPPCFDPAQDFGEVRDNDQRFLVQRDALFETNGRYVGPA